MTAAAPSRLTRVTYLCTSPTCRATFVLRFGPGATIRRSMLMTTPCCHRYERVVRFDRRPLSGGAS